jgi:hypothetical protein
MSNDQTNNDTAYTVRVVEHRSEPLAGLGDCEYHSPKHSLAHALALPRVLLGTEPGRWTVPIAGGRRQIDLEEVRTGE